MDAMSKYSHEVRDMIFDYTNFPECIAGDNISTVSSIIAFPTNGLVIGGGTVSLNQVFASISGGTPEETSDITCLAITTEGWALAIRGSIAIY